MTFAKANVLRKIPTGPNPVIWDYKQLLGSKLRAAWDVRVGGEFDDGVWVSHTDVVSGIRVEAPTPAQRPLAQVDGSNFRGRRAIRLTAAGPRKMVTQAMPDVVPVNTRPEVFMVARLPSGVTPSGNLCGCANALADPRAGASFWTNGSALNGVAAGATSVAYADTTGVHLFSAFADDTQSRLLIDNVQVATGALDTTLFATTQAAIGGFATGYIVTNDAFAALWGICCPAMTSEERAQFFAIARADWGF